MFPSPYIPRSGRLNRYKRYLKQEIAANCEKSIRPMDPFPWTSEFKFFAFVLLWFKLIRYHLMLGPANSNSDQPVTTIFAYDLWHTRPMLLRHAYNLFWWPENEVWQNQNEIFITLEWKSSDEMGPGHYLREVDLPRKCRGVSPVIDIHSSIKAIHKSVIDIMDIHNSMDGYNSVVHNHNSVIYIYYGYPDLHYGEIAMDIHDLIMDVYN